MGLVDFELQAFLPWRFSPKYPNLTFFKVNISENTLPNDLKLYRSSILVTYTKCINFDQNLRGYRFKHWVIRHGMTHIMNKSL